MPTAKPLLQTGQSAFIPTAKAPGDFSAPTTANLPTTSAKVTADQFAETIKAKYPQYASVDNNTLTQKMLAKYPQYADRIALPANAAPEPDILQKASDFITKANLPGAQLGKAIGNSVYSLGKAGIQTVKGDLPGAAATLKQGAAENNANFGRVVGDTIRSTALPASLAAAPVTLPGVVGTSAGFGAAQTGGSALARGAKPIDVVKQTALGGVVGGAVGAAAYGIGKLVGTLGDKIQTSVIKPTKPDIQDGYSLDTIKKYDLGGSLRQTLEKTQNTMGDLTGQLNEKLASSGARVNLDDVFKDTVTELTDASKLKGFGANIKVASGLQQLKDEIGVVNAEGGLSIPDSQVVKQAAGNFGAWQYGKPDPESKATEIVYNTFYNKLKTAIEQSSPAGVKEINAQLAKLIPVQNAIIRRLPVAERSGVISLNEMIGLVGSTVHPAALGPTLLAMASRSGQVGNLLSKLGPKIQSAASTIGSLAGTTPAILPGQ